MIEIVQVRTPDQIEAIRALLREYLTWGSDGFGTRQMVFE